MSDNPQPDKKPEVKVIGGNTTPTTKITVKRLQADNHNGFVWVRRLDTGAKVRLKTNIPVAFISTADESALVK